jgi:hypothetical protein
LIGPLDTTPACVARVDAAATSRPLKTELNFIFFSKRGGISNSGIQFPTEPLCTPSTPRNCGVNALDVKREVSLFTTA